MTFLERAVAGEIADLDEGINDAIDAWHQQADHHLGVPLHQGLGITRDEYRAWVKDASALARLVEARRAAAPR